jgi:DNA-binding response OmpR family regulator
MSRGNIVLVVEDEEHIRLVVEYNLRRDGFEVYLAEDGPTGLELARKVIPDVVLLDWMLPGMDGLEVLTELKHDKKTEHIPVFMLTAKGMASDIDRAFELGADDYITKPFDPRLLGEIIKKKLEEPREVRIG